MSTVDMPRYDRDLALVIPCYNEARRLPSALQRLSQFASEAPLSLQLIIVDDGSTDETVAIASSFLPPPGITIEVISIPHRGKGAAVRAGLASARAPVVGYCDVDLSAGPNAIQTLLERVQSGSQVVIASRGVPGSVLERRQPWYRERAGRLYNVLLRLLLRIDVHDTQCGLKLMRADAANSIFRYQRLDGFAFDAELVVLSLRLGFSVDEVPIRWAHNSNSKLSVLRDSFRMGRDMIRIVRRLRKGAVHRLGVPSTETIDAMASSERTHWWYTAKRRIVFQTLDRVPGGPCLDLGCGAGAMLAEIAASRPAFGVDLSLHALSHARTHGIAALAQSDAGSLPFRSGSFTVVLALDVIEHYSRPEVLLAEIKRVLAPDGVLVVTVPAYQWMWSYADHLLGHYRRYTRPTLDDELRASGFRVDRLTHFHSWLLPLAWLFRRGRAVVGRTTKTDDFPVPRTLNLLLEAVTRLEMSFIRTRDVGFGLSILAIARPEMAPR